MTLAKAAGHFTETEIDDEIVVMSLDSGDFFSLTGPARAIWLALDEGMERAGLIARLATAFETEPAALAADVDAFLGQLRSAGLLVRD